MSPATMESIKTPATIQQPQRPVLEVNNVTMQFGGLKALSDFNLSLRPKELLALIGPNGAGKTTAFNVLTGVYRPSAGEIRLSGKKINGLRPHQICRLGLARTFQNIRLFKNLSVLDNIRIACHGHSATHWWQALLVTGAHFKEEAGIKKHAEHLLAVLGLSHRKNELAKNLPYGEQRRLEMARALATQPKILCLDEPAAGMNASETTALMGLIKKIRDDFDVAVLLIEHDMKLVMGISERVLVLDYGITIAAGTPESVRRNPKVIEAYLGIGAAAGPRPEDAAPE